MKVYVVMENFDNCEEYDMHHWYDKPVLVVTDKHSIRDGIMKRIYSLIGSVRINDPYARITISAEEWSTYPILRIEGSEGIFRHETNEYEYYAVEFELQES